MTNSLYNILANKLWGAQTLPERKTLFQLLIFWATLVVLSVVFLAVNFIFRPGEFCIICNLLLISMTALASFCTVNGRIACSLNAAFGIPLVVYSYYLSDFNSHPPFMETVYVTLAWLTAGLFFLLYFSDSYPRIRAYFVIALLTMSFHLLKANHLWDSFSYFSPVVTNPLLIFILLAGMLYVLHKKYQAIIVKTEEALSDTLQGITKVMQESEFAIARLKAHRDEAGNILHFTVEKVNNAFEAGFNINLYEVQDQKADYIFNLIFKSKFDLNKIILGKSKKAREFHAANLERWFNIHVLQPDYDQFYLVFEDITKVKARIAELEENKRRYKVLLEAIPDMFFVIDKDGTYEDLVIKESDKLKMEDVNIIGSTIYDVGFPENMADKIYACIQSCIKNHSIETIEYQMNTPNGTFLFEMRLARLNAHSVISIARDITKRKTIEIKLEKALVKAEESDRLKSAFLANLSHEIKTPMNVITNFTRMLTDPDLEYEEKLEISDAIFANGKQLLNMIDNTIHLSKIETQSVELDHQFCNINAELRKIYNNYRILIPDSKNIRLNLKIGVPNPEFGFETDPVLLTEIISMLLDNALKYTMEGEITLEYDMIRNEWVQFRVSDTGIGIPEEEQKNIFRRFYRVPNKINETTSGSGLGLPIVQHYVALLGGELEFSSEPGKGSVFWFALPFREGKGFLSVVK